MSFTRTPHAQLFKPDVGTSEPFDIEDHNEDADILDQRLIHRFTSGTRPTTNLYIGLTIVETDTLLTLQWNGTIWAPITPRIYHNVAWSSATNAQGDTSYNFPVPFVNNLLGFTVQDTSNPALLGAMIYKILPGLSDKTKAAFRVYDPAGVALVGITGAATIIAWGN